MVIVGDLNLLKMDWSDHASANSEIIALIYLLKC